MSAWCEKRLNAPQQSVAYSITSSARASTSTGMSGLTAVAVLRLTMSSELVGAGTEPLHSPELSQLTAPPDRLASNR